MATVRVSNPPLSGAGRPVGSGSSAAAPARQAARFENLSYWYPDRVGPALLDVCLTIEPGLTLVAGGSGGGKSTLLRALDGLVPQFHGGRVAGSAVVAGLDPLRTPIREMATRVGLVFQDAETQSVYGTVEREVAFGLENVGLSRALMHERVDEALDQLGIEGLRGRRLATLSGGERQRVQIAAVIALRPEILTLDEPTSQLDRDGAAAVTEACLRLASAGRTVVIAEHRLDRLLPAADRLATVDGGEVAGPLPPAALAAGLATLPAIVELGVALGWDPLPLTVEAARRLRPALPPGAWAVESPAHRHLSGGPAWELRGVAAGPGREAAVEGVDLGGCGGEVVVLMGPNGSGKTTLLRALGGLLEPLSGEVRRPAGRCAYLPQNPAALLHLPTVRAEVELTLRRARSTDRPEEILDAFGLLGLADRYPRDLSAGERQRAALAAILAGSPGLALLDEPTRGMDLAARRALGAAIASLRAAGAAVVLATHDVDLAAEVADRIVLISDGRATDLGPPERALAAGSEFATQIGRLFPDGPVTVEGALRAIRGAGGGTVSPVGAIRGRTARTTPIGGRSE